METKDAKTVATTLVEQFILKYGHFKVLKSDRGTEFTNELMKHICDLLQIKQIFSSPYHHQTLGSIERNHRVLNEFLLTCTTDYDWDKWIPYFAFAYNTTPHVETQYSPYELVFGKLPYLPNDIINKKHVIYDLDDYTNELRHRLNLSLNKAKEYLDIAKRRNKTHYDKKTNVNDFSVGDYVLVRNINRKKCQSPYHGPYKIVEKSGTNSTLDVNNKEKSYHDNLLKKFTGKTP